MFQFIHWGVWQSPRERVKEHLKAHPLYINIVPLQDIHWTLINLTLCTRKSTASPGQSRKPWSYVYRTPPQLQYRQIPTASHMGPAVTVIASVSTKTNISTPQHCLHVPPTGTPQHPHSPFLSTVHLGGGLLIFP